MKFIVTAGPAWTDPLPERLRPLEGHRDADAVVTRDFELRRFTEPCAGSIWLVNGLQWDDVDDLVALVLMWGPCP